MGKLDDTEDGGGTLKRRCEEPVREALLEVQPWKVAAVGPDATVLEALALMERRNICAVVVTEGDDIAGIVSERDCARRVLLEGKDPGRTPVEAVMSREVCSVTANKNVSECIDLMLRRRIRHLPVLFGRFLVGCVSLRDLMMYCYGINTREEEKESEDGLRHLEA